VVSGRNTVIAIGMVVIHVIAVILILLVSVRMGTSCASLGIQDITIVIICVVIRWMIRLSIIFIIEYILVVIKVLLIICRAGIFVQTLPALLGVIRIYGNCDIS
jgi:hypothetical protein